MFRTTMAISCILALAVSGAVADVVTVISSADTYVRSGDADNTFGDSTYIYLGDNDRHEDEKMRGYLLFDTSGLSSGDSIASVTLNLWLNRAALDPDEDDLEVSVYEAAIDTPWDDDGDSSDGAYTPSWNSQPSGEHWRTGSLLDSMIFTSSSTADQYYTLDVTDAWATTSAFDLVLDMPANAGQWQFDWIRFHTSEWSGYEPYLEVTYGDPEPVPEPGTLALFGIGLPALIGWKRRREA